MEVLWHLRTSKGKKRKRREGGRSWKDKSMRTDVHIVIWRHFQRCPSNLETLLITRCVSTASSFVGLYNQSKDAIGVNWTKAKQSSFEHDWTRHKMFLLLATLANCCWEWFWNIQCPLLLAAKLFWEIF